MSAVINKRLNGPEEARPFADGSPPPDHAP